MKTSGSNQNQRQLLQCPQCELSFKYCTGLVEHQMRGHHDTWAVIELLEAGVSDKVASQMYEKCSSRSFGSGRKRKRDDRPVIEDPERNRQISQLFSQLGALQMLAGQMLVTKPEPKIELEDVKLEETMKESWIVNEDVFHKDISDEAADTDISDNNDDNQELMDAADTFELPAKDNEVYKEPATQTGETATNEHVTNAEQKLCLPPDDPDEPLPVGKNDVEIIPNNQKTLATETFNASVLTFVDSNEKEMQRLAQEIDEMLEQEMAGLEGGSQDL